MVILKASYFTESFIVGCEYEMLLKAFMSIIPPLWMYSKRLCVLCLGGRGFVSL
jgi:hypothetical protein